MSRKLTTKPLCGKCADGWLEADDGTITGRCPCRTTAGTTTPQQERDAALQATADANPDAMRAALLIIEDAAHSEAILSSNSVRSRMNIANIPGPVRGAAFGRAVKLGYLLPAGTEASTDGPTHGHHIRIYESLILRRSA